MRTLQKFILSLVAIFTLGAVLAPAIAQAQNGTQGGGEIEMATVMMQSGKIYVVVAVLLIIFLGLAIYLFLLDRRIRKMENEANITG